MYDVGISLKDWCTCNDYKNNQLYCKHIYYILIKKLQVHDQDAALFQEYLSVSDVQKLFSAYDARDISSKAGNPSAAAPDAASKWNHNVAAAGKSKDTACSSTVAAIPQISKLSKKMSNEEFLSIVGKYKIFKTNDSKIDEIAVNHVILKVIQQFFPEKVAVKYFKSNQRETLASAAIKCVYNTAHPGKCTQCTLKKTHQSCKLGGDCASAFKNGKLNQQDSVINHCRQQQDQHKD